MSYQSNCETQHISVKMKYYSKRLLLFVLFSILSIFILFSQEEDKIEYQIYDIVYMKKGVDIKGEIQSFNEQNGLIVIKDLEGRFHTLSIKDYEFFEKGKTFKKKIRANRPRKEEGIAFSVGLTSMIMYFNDDFTPDATFLEADGIGDLPISLKVGASKYLDNKNIIGLTAELAVVTENDSYYNIGARYLYLFSPKKNTSFYFPVEIKYARLRFKESYYINSSNPHYDTERIAVETSITASEINIGQGVSFSLKNKKSFSIELMFVNEFILSKDFQSKINTKPVNDHKVYAVKIGLLMDF